LSFSGDSIQDHHGGVVFGQTR